MSSKVYFTDFRCLKPDTMYKKLEKLIDSAGMGSIDFQDKFVAVKIHFGEYGCVSHIRHQYAKIVCDYIKERGGKPFLTDANTLYVGYRNNAVDHLDCAYLNGFSPLQTGVQTIIADGLRGTDEREIEVAGAKHCPVAKIGAAVVEADIIISMTHTKGHQVAGFGGVLKNIGMGCGSKRGKMEMHSSATPLIEKDKCIGCGMCKKNCNNNGVDIVDGKAVINEENCLGCGYCFAYCPKGAIICKWDEATAVMSEKVAEYTKAVLEGKPSFHISFAQHVCKYCDCNSTTDVAMVPDVGIFASFDPIALDQACFDKISKQPLFADSPAGEAAIEAGEHVHDGVVSAGSGHDVFTMVHPDTKWEAGLKHGEVLGLGNREYELVEV